MVYATPALALHARRVVPSLRVRVGRFISKPYAFCRLKSGHAHEGLSYTAAASSTAPALISTIHQIITDPYEEVELQRDFIRKINLDLRGRIYMNEQGINAHMSGRGTDGETYVGWVASKWGPSIF